MFLHAIIQLTFSAKYQGVVSIETIRTLLAAHTIKNILSSLAVEGEFCAIPSSKSCQAGTGSYYTNPFHTHA
jgi:hypothetical protein